MIFKKTNVLKALAFTRDHYSNEDGDKVEDIDKITSKMKENDIDVLHILFLLNKLGANPSSADSHGNTALHYATLLPLFGVTQEATMDICTRLRKYGALFDVKNHRRQSPLQFCMSTDNWKVVIENNKLQSSIRGLVEVLIEVLKLLSPKEAAVRNAVNNTDTLLNSPLHFWASIALKLPQDYTTFGTGDHTFENTLRIILQHLLECGAKLNPRNENEETPLHLCETWTAVKLLLDAGANPKDVDLSGSSPLFVAAKEINFLRKPDYLYLDVTEDPETFWKSALEKRLDPWTADKQGDSVLSVLIESKAFILARTLVEVACKENHATNDVKLSFLNIICKDESKHTHWKTILIEVILNSASKNQLSVESPLRFCCENIVRFGMFDDKPDQQKPKDEPSDDDGQPPSKKRRKDESSMKEEEKQESNEEQATYDSVHWKIAKQLLSYGVNVSIRDESGKSCLDIAEACPSLRDLLTKPIEIDKIPIRIPWTSVSHNYKGLLAKVARGQECEMVDQIWYHTSPIGSGSFGCILAGINEKDGREVAMKRIEKSRLQQPQDRREIENLIDLADCEQVVLYLSFSDDKHFSYVILELMEGNLDEYLNGSTTNTTQATLFCKDVVMGLKFLHERNILHRDLKPGNILYKVQPNRVCLKIADFGLSSRIDTTSTAATVYNTKAGTRCWMARELLMSSKDYSKASDMFSCGLLLHYILSGRKHPFNPTDCASKGERQIASETEANIMKGKMEGWDDSLSPEATHLVKRMLESNERNRPSAKEALEHPLFWSNEKKVDFLKAIGNQKEFKCPRSKRPLPLTQVEIDLKKGFGTIVSHGRWNDRGYLHMPHIYTEMIAGKGRNFYDTSSAVELVRFIRNVYEHYEEKKFSTRVPIERLLFDDFVFLENFAYLVMEVYKAVTTHGWDQTRDDVKFAMYKK